MDNLEARHSNCGEKEVEVELTDNAVLQGVAVTCDCCCEKQQDITFNPCEDVKDFTIQDVVLKCEGRLLKVRVNLDRVCAGRKIALGVMVCENVGGTFFTRGLRACEFTVPGTPGNCVDNVNVNEFCFIFPEENLCSTRRFKVNVVAHYSSFPSFPFCPC